MPITHLDHPAARPADRTAVSRIDADLVTRGIADTRRFADPCLERLKLACAETARLKESLDLLPVPAFIVDRAALGSLPISFMNHAAMHLMGLDEQEAEEGDTELALACFPFPSAARILTMLHELHTSGSMNTILYRNGRACHVRLMLRALEADLGDSVLCTLLVEADTDR